jgi:VanZ family protein
LSKIRYFFALIIVFNCFTFCKAKENIQSNDTLQAAIKRQRIYGLAAGFSIGYSSSLVMLHRAWYSQETRSNFHFHNDIRDWNQIDKAGHFWTAFHQSRIGIDAMRWAGVEEKKAIFYGGALGIILQTPIEIFDGYSPTYGASVSDAVANIAGSIAVIAQELKWGQVKIMPKFSYHPSGYQNLRPNLFGRNLGEQLLKDYNGQSYWLSFDLSLFKKTEKINKSWINLAIGYGSMGMMYGNPNQNFLLGHNSFRRIFIGPDINLMNLKVKNKLVQKLFYVMSSIRIPMPALEIKSNGKILMHPIYF